MWVVNELMSLEMGRDWSQDPVDVSLRQQQKTHHEGILCVEVAQAGGLALALREVFCHLPQEETDPEVQAPQRKPPAVCCSSELCSSAHGGLQGETHPIALG